MTEKPHVRIKSWRIANYGDELSIYGEVYGHPRLTDGHRIVTSLILHIDEQNGIVETRNTIYHLEEQAV